MCGCNLSCNLSAGTLAQQGARPERFEPYASVRGKWHYLYLAVDKQGKSVDFLLRRDRGIAAAQAFFLKASATNPT
jgi:transposase-like protein